MTQTLFLKKGAYWRLFLCLLTGLLSPCIAAAADTACTATADETATVKYIHDGDTLRLKDGRKVRLIGINTPEAARDNHAAEAYSAEATKALKSRFARNKQISLIYGAEKYDRYKRLLAHGFTATGENIQATLLTQGYARNITIPPNTRFLECYQKREREARCNKTGLWQKNTVVDAKKLSSHHIGFQLVTGKLININRNKKGIWLNIENKLSIGIRPHELPLFNVKQIYSLLNQKIVVRGWLNKSKKATPYYVRIRHPASIQSASSFRCNKTD